MKSDKRVVIIGGGATGTGILRDLTLRGVECVLVERGDLATGTSGRFHGLLHSGARYAVKDPHSARECLEENRIVKSIAPFCVEDTGGLFISTRLDDPGYAGPWLDGCRKAGIPVEEVSVREARAAEPCVALDITRAFSVPDAAIDGFTLAWANAAAAMEKGSVVKTYSSVVGFLIEDGVVKGVRVRSARSAEEDLISCDYVINAAGAWAGEVASLAGQVIDLVPDRGTLMIFHHRLASRVLNRLRAPSDGDIFVPHGTVTIFGTTSKPAAGPDDLDVSPDEVLDLLEEGAPLVPSVKCARIIRAFAGVRPLYQPGAGQGREVTRGFTLIDHSESGLEGMISIVGGKLTTYRLMAQAASDLAAAKLRVAAPCMTALEPLKDPITMPISPDTSRIRLDDDLYFCECERVGPSRIESAADLLRKSMGSAGSEFSSGFIGDLRRLTRLGMGPCQGAFCTVRAAAYAHENIGISVEEGNRLIAEHARERWKGTRPVLWGAQARQAELARGIYQGLLNLHRAHKESHDL